MCGIIAYIGRGLVRSRNVLLQGLTIMQSRGYDSVGAAIMCSGEKSVELEKFVSGKNCT